MAINARPAIGALALVVLGGLGWYGSQPPGSAADWALLDAARWGNEAECRKLLSEGANVNFERKPARYRLWFPGDPEPDQGYTALHHAAEAGHLGIAKILLEAGARVNTKNAMGNSPLVMAVTMTEKEMVAALLKAGADAKATNRAGLSPIEFAIKRNPEPAQEEIADLLRASGATDKTPPTGGGGPSGGP